MTAHPVDLLAEAEAQLASRRESPAVKAFEARFVATTTSGWLSPIAESERFEIPEPVYDCAECRDSGYVPIEHDPLSRRRCACRDPRTNTKSLRDSMARAGAGEDEIRWGLSKWDESAQEKPKFARQWMEWNLSGKAPADIPPEILKLLRSQKRQRLHSPWCLTLIGDPGVGKTKTSSALMAMFFQILGEEPKVMWARAPDAFDRIQKERKEFGFSPWEDRYIAADLVIMDEFGFRHRTNAQQMTATLAAILQRRHAGRRPGRRFPNLTIVNANVSTLNALGDDALISRLSGGVWCKLGGKDQRRGTV